MTNQKSMIIGAMVIVGGILAYRHFAKGKLNLSPMDGEETSNASGISCKCENGLQGWCASGDCKKCCTPRRKNLERSNTSERTIRPISVRRGRAMNAPTRGSNF